jgi:hypothetical protein
MARKRTIIGIVDSQSQAESIIYSLQRAGFPLYEVSVLLPDKRGTADFAHEHNTKAPEGAVAGVASGGVIGGTLGLLVGIGALAIPGLGPLIAAGPLMATLSGAAAGAAVGGIAGALVGLGIPEIEAKKYEGKVRGGNILIAVHVEDNDREDRAREVMQLGGAHDISATTEASVPKGAQSAQK